MRSNPSDLHIEKVELRELIEIQNLKQAQYISVKGLKYIADRSLFSLIISNILAITFKDGLKTKEQPYLLEFNLTSKDNYYELIVTNFNHTGTNKKDFEHSAIINKLIEQLNGTLKEFKEKDTHVWHIIIPRHKLSSTSPSKDPNNRITFKAYQQMIQGKTH